MLCYVMYVVRKIKELQGDRASSRIRMLRLRNCGLNSTHLIQTYPLTVEHIAFWFALVHHAPNYVSHEGQL
jgi:hypothetical protein